MVEKAVSTKTSRKTLVTLIAIIVLVLGGVAGGIVVAIQGLSGTTGKPLTQVADPWLQNGTDAAFTMAMLNRNTMLQEVSAIALRRSKNPTILDFANSLTKKTQEWDTKLGPLFEQHGIKLDALNDSLSDNYSGWKDAKIKFVKATDANFDKTFVAQMNIVSRIDLSRLQSDSAIINDSFLKTLAAEIADYTMGFGQQLSGWTKK